MKTTPDITLADLVRACLRLNPDRIIVGEVRGKETLEMLKAWNTGMPGGVSTIHANSASEGLSRIEQLIGEVSQVNDHTRKMTSEAVDVMIYMEKSRGERKVKEVMKVEGFFQGEYKTENL